MSRNGNAADPEAPQAPNIPLNSEGKPEILAPAGDPEALKAALAAGADAVYLGLKHFSARMAAANFSVTDLARHAALCREHGAKLYLALNTLIKPGELDNAGRLIDRVTTALGPLDESGLAALIVQDPGALKLAREAGFQGELHLSTLANATHPAALASARALGADRVVLPRELNIDEIKAMDQAAQAVPGLALEVFVHGALCFCVSGRCYWSSYMGGKSGLRGRCVQPCRRGYQPHQPETRGGRQPKRPPALRRFSCLDLSLDVLARTLTTLPTVRAWKIEGRKKSAHYVFYATTAYRLLRDEGGSAEVRKEAEAILAKALSRPTTKYAFLPQRPNSPLGLGGPSGGETGSGRFVGRVVLTPEGTPYLAPRFPLLAGDALRIGSEDEAGHRILRIRKNVPKNGRLDLKPPKPFRGKPEGTPAPGAKPGPKGKFAAKKAKPFASRKLDKTTAKGSPVYLIDRREPELKKILAEMSRKLDALDAPPAPKASTYTPHGFTPWRVLAEAPADQVLRRQLPKGKMGRVAGAPALWLAGGSLKAVSRTLFSKIRWWLPPVVWPREEAEWLRRIEVLVKEGGRHFVLNAPWQVGLFTQEMLANVVLTAGPFCNLANGYALEAMAELGCTAAIVSPELSREDFLALPGQSPIPLGFVVSGYYPVGVARNVNEVDPALKTGEVVQSPMGETFFGRTHGENLWLFPGWPLDFSEKKEELRQAGYAFFISMEEFAPKDLTPPSRTSLFNWDAGLL